MLSYQYVLQLQHIWGFMKYAFCPLFNDISDANLKRLLKCLKAKEVKYSTDDLICSYNNKSNVLGVLLSGKAYIKKLDRDGNLTILETLVKHSVFSDTFAYTATDANCIEIYACEPTTIIFIDYNSVFKRCSEACEFHSQFVVNFMKIIIDKSKILSQRVEILSNKTIKDKVLSYCSLMVNGTHSYTFTLPMSYTSFAQYLCVDRSAMMRELKKLNDQGILSINKKQITVLSKEYI